MHRTDSLLWRWRHRRRPLVVLALTAVLMLLTAPLRTIIAGCDLCPPDCPMHAAHRAAAHVDEGDAPRMHCHNGGATHRDGADSHAPRISRPPCGSHAAVTGLDLAPMLPAGPLAWIVAPRIAGAPPRLAAAGNRAADPPDTPPPDLRA
jgi:hypothetical protein